jgi:hypothetical protein
MITGMYLSDIAVVDIPNDQFCGEGNGMMGSLREKEMWMSGMEKIRVLRALYLRR